MAETAATAPQPGRPAEPGSLRPRILSSLVLIPVAAAAVFFGAPWSSLLAALAAGIMAAEWGRLVGRLHTPLDRVLVIGTALGAVLVASFVAIRLGLLLGVAGIALQGWLGRRRDATPAWTAGGLAWIIGPSIGFVWLRDDPLAGLGTTAWVLGLVWAVDTLAYVGGRTFGGPRLIPRVSPKKTWSGLLSGIVGAVLVGEAAGVMTGSAHLGYVIALSGVLAIIAQIGDLVESYAKRRFGAKDSGTLIPGHGGLLDRLDGMLAVVVAVVVISLVIGESVLTWH